MNSYHELYNLDPEQAKRRIQSKGKDVYIVSMDQMVTCDFRPDRVRIWIDAPRYE
jgi:hypothetical protein